jgi:hypothetical protein
MTRSRPQAPPTEAELRTTLETLRHECAVARQRVLRLLAAGQDTADLRMEITALERRISDIVALARLSQLGRKMGNFLRAKPEKASRYNGRGFENVCSGDQASFRLLSFV